MKKLFLLMAALPLLVTACFNHTASLSVSGEGLGAPTASNLQSPGALPPDVLVNALYGETPELLQSVSNSAVDPAAGDGTTAGASKKLRVELTGGVTLTKDFDIPQGESRLSYDIDDLPIGPTVDVDVSIWQGDTKESGTEFPERVRLAVGTNEVNVTLVEALQKTLIKTTVDEQALHDGQQITTADTIRFEYGDNETDKVIHVSESPAVNITDNDTSSPTLRFSAAGNYTVTAYARAKGYAPSAPHTWSINVPFIKSVRIPGAIVSENIGADGGPFANAAASPVTVAAFSIAETELTYAQWKEVYDWATGHGYTFANPGKKGGATSYSETEHTDNEPVTYVTWRDAVVWCNAASEREGLSPAYLVNGVLVRDSTRSFDDVENGVGTNGYRLPTEQEWEFAARGGNPSNTNYWSYKYAGTNEDDQLGDYAWYNENSGDKTHEVKTRQPNGAGLYDMSGNVWEWCWDIRSKDPYRRVSRGGGWYGGVQGDPKQRYTVAYRDGASMDVTDGRGIYDYLGFRVVRSGN